MSLRFEKLNLSIILFLFVFVGYGTIHATELVSASIFHWNDLHSMNMPQLVRKFENTVPDSVGGVHYLSGLLHEWRNSVPTSLTFDAGDEFTGGPISALSKGKKQADVLNLLKPDVIAVGNHEFDYGMDALKDFQSALDSSISLVSANLVYKDSQQPIFIQEKTFVRNGVVFAIIAFTLEDLASVVHPKHLDQVEIRAIIPIARNFVQRMESHADVLIAVTHQGLEQDIQLALNVPGFDLIVGGHSHSITTKDYLVNGTRIVQAGQYGRYLGRVDLKVDTVKNEVIQSMTTLVEIGPNRGLPVDSNLYKILIQHEKIVQDELGKVIGELKTDFIRKFDGESNVGNWVCESLQNYLGTDIGLYNSGGIRVDWLRGPIRKIDVWQLEPFGNSVVRISVSGSELKKMFEYRLQVSQDFIQCSGIQIQSEGNKILSLKVNDKECNDKQIYTIATNQYVAAQWKKYFGYPLDAKQIVDIGIPTKDVFIQRIEKEQVIHSSIHHWWVKK
ncbi:MAG: bifunctional metallophosphatase/5'-nucleotidase [bacterium]|nr:bifunctional metallophosphatase/5'-nucleotidase [bacterium]